MTMNVVLQLKKYASWLLLPVLATVLISVGCDDAAPSPQDLIPKTDLPSGIELTASSEEAVRDYPPSELGHTPPTAIRQNVTSLSLAKYRHGPSGDAYHVLVVKCKNEGAAEQVLETYSSLTFGEERFEVKDVSFNGHHALEGYAPSTSDYVYFWRNEEFVFGVVGNSRDAALGLAEATGY